MARFWMVDPIAVLTFMKGPRRLSFWAYPMDGLEQCLSTDDQNWDAEWKIHGIPHILPVVENG